jgi:hypothetical protein
MPAHNTVKPISPAYQRQNCRPAARSSASTPKNAEAAMVAMQIAEVVTAACDAGSRGRAQKIAPEVIETNRITSRVAQLASRAAPTPNAVSVTGTVSSVPSRSIR